LIGCANDAIHFVASFDRPATDREFFRMKSQNRQECFAWAEIGGPEWLWAMGSVRKTIRVLAANELVSYLAYGEVL
jgi:hypothetical protein